MENLNVILTVAQNIVGFTQLTEFLGASRFSVAARMKLQRKPSITMLEKKKKENCENKHHTPETKHEWRGFNFKRPFSN